jgi:hypothetical protein
MIEMRWRRILFSSDEVLPNGAIPIVSPNSTKVVGFQVLQYIDNNVLIPEWKDVTTDD